MSALREIEEAVRKLSPEEFKAFRNWFAEFDAAVWDRQIEVDAAAGRLDKFAEQAIEDARGGRCTEL